MKKVLLLILGLAVIVLGIVSFFVPEILYYVLGIGAIVYGISDLIAWRKKRKLGFGSVISLIGAIGSFAAGVFMLFCDPTNDIEGYYALRIVFLVLFIWLIFSGIMEIISAVIYRQAMTTAELGVQAPGSIASLVFGFIMAGVGAVGIFSPMFSFLSVGLIVVISVIAAGVRLVGRAFTG